MKVVMRVNLGRDDASELKIATPGECLAGRTVDIDKAAADALLSRGVAVLPDDSAKDDVIQSLHEEEMRRDEAKIKAVAKEPKLKGT